MKQEIWEGFIPGIGKDVSLTSIILSPRYKGYQADKGDPFAFFFGRLLLRQPLLYRIWITNGRIRIG